MAYKLDETDIKLINLLQEDSKQSIKELSAKLNLTIGPVHERIKKLERNGLIKKYVALIDLEKVEKDLITYCAVSVDKHTKENLEKFEKSVRKMSEVLECYTIAGSHDYLLKIIVEDMAAYQDFVINKLSALESVSNVQSQFVIKHVKFSTAVML